MTKKRSKHDGKKPKAKRDYKAEYRARIERALKLGYSRSVARGHPKKSKTKREVGIRLARKLDLEPGEDLRKIIDADRVRVFGGKFKRKKSDLDFSDYLMRLSEEAKHPERGMFDWLDEEAFIAQMVTAGFSGREAYTVLAGS